jgi:hypothetical protein
MTEKVMNEDKFTKIYSKPIKDIKYNIRVLDFNTVVIDKIVIIINHR